MSSESSVDLCIICYEDPVDTNINFGTCNHQNLCSKCLKRTYSETGREKCPQCNQQMSDTILFNEGVLKIRENIKNKYCVWCSAKISIGEIFQICPTRPIENACAICLQCYDEHDIAHIVAKACECGFKSKSHSLFPTPPQIKRQMKKAIEFNQQEQIDGEISKENPNVNSDQNQNENLNQNLNVNKSNDESGQIYDDHIFNKNKDNSEMEQKAKAIALSSKNELDESCEDIIVILNGSKSKQDNNHNKNYVVAEEEMKQSETIKASNSNSFVNVLDKLIDEDLIDDEETVSSLVFDDLSSIKSLNPDNRSQLQSLPESAAESVELVINNNDNVKIDPSKVKYFYNLSKSVPEISSSLSPTVEISGSEGATPPILLSQLRRKRARTPSSKQEGNSKKRIRTLIRKF